jgi:fructose-1,6-bisphosphatase/inositol monophosphatase family enzyme
MFDHADPYVGMMRDFMQKTAGIRRPGAAALDLANVAAGRLDGFWEIGLHPWDMAAGVLMVLEAGGLVGDLEGQRGLPRERTHRRRIAPDLRADDQRHRAAPDTRTAHRTAEAGVGSGLNR